MSKVTSNQKVYRVVEFIMGMRYPEAYRPLTAYGLTQIELKRARDLLRDATEPRLSHRPNLPITPHLLERMDRVDNHWFPIVKYSLTHHDPEIAEWTFLNLVQTSGPDLVVSLGTLFGRIAELADGTSPFGERGREAFAILQTRGLTDEVIDDVHALLDSVHQFEETTDVFDAEGYEQAVDKLWAWYLEWGGIARTVIKDRRTLKRLGFLRPKGSPAPTPDEEREEREDEADANANVVPTPSTPSSASGSGERPAVATGDESVAV